MEDADQMLLIYSKLTDNQYLELCALQLIRESDFVTNHWAGGCTQQMWIWPEHSSLANRDFLMRISSATVELDGDFSDFTGYQRWLTLVSGNGLSIKQQSLGHSQHFMLFNDRRVWAFSGEDKVSVQLINGNIVDFNVIVKPPISAIVQQLDTGITPCLVTTDDEASIITDDRLTKLWLTYVVDGAIEIPVNVKGPAILQPQHMSGPCLVISDNSQLTVVSITNEKLRLSVKSIVITNPNRTTMGHN